MAGAMRKMAVYLGLVEDTDYEEYDDYDDVRRDVRGRDSRSSSSSRGSSDRYDDRYDERADDRYRTNSVRTIPDGRSSQQPETRGERTFRSDTEPDRRPTTAPLADRRPMDISRIENIHPRSYNDARRIGEHYRDGVPVIMNLTELDDTDAKRIIDFAAGLVFGLRGSIERITNKVFLLSPPNVDVGDQARAQVAEDGFFNQS
jgi:cell division inhibitor SepF